MASQVLPRVCSHLQESIHRAQLTGQGPLRHPQPLTPSDLHLVLEKEQEAMVSIGQESEHKTKNADASIFPPGESIDSRVIPSAATDSIRSIYSILYLHIQ